MKTKKESRERGGGAWRRFARHTLSIESETGWNIVSTCACGKLRFYRYSDASSTTHWGMIPRPYNTVILTADISTCSFRNMNATASCPYSLTWYKHIRRSTQQYMDFSLATNLTQSIWCSSESRPAVE
ncbi:unnamed protein product [Pylaiella littoralis]